MRTAIFLPLFLLLITLCGCLPQTVENQILERGTQAGAALSSPYFEVVNSEEDFSRLYRRIHSGELPPPQPPPVNFEKSFVLVIAMGEKPTAGYAVEIGQVVRKGQKLKVEVRFIEPSSERMLAAVITRPYALVRIERQPGLQTVVFVDPSGKRLAAVPLTLT
jgi:hypothetical protein